MNTEDSGANVVKASVNHNPVVWEKDRPTFEIRVDGTDTLGDFAKACGYPFKDVEVRFLVNGIEQPMEYVLRPGDWIDVTPQPGYEALVMALAGAGWAIGGAIGGTTGAIIGATVLPALVMIGIGVGVSVLGGVLVNALTPTPKSAITPKESPSYGWNLGQTYNPAVEGGPIPVYYGNTITTPPVIGRFFSASSAYAYTYYPQGYGAGPLYLTVGAMYPAQSLRMLFLLGEGYASAVPASTDIYVNGSPISIYDNYEVKFTSGSSAPETTSLDLFEKIHQYSVIERAMSGVLADDYVVTLLHCDGAHGSTTLTNEISTGCDFYTLPGAQLTTTNPFIGSACLTCTAASAYGAAIPGTTAQAKSVHLFSDATQTFDMEMRWWAQESTISYLFGGHVHTPSSVWHYYILRYTTADKLEFNYSRKNADGTTDVYFSIVSTLVNMATGTWHHVRAARDYNATAGDTVRLYFDGQMVGESTCLNSSGISVFPDETVGSRLRIGSAANHNTTAYSKSRFDEIRIEKGQLLYNWGDFVPPGEILGADTVEHIKTKGVIDAFCVMICAHKGMYFINELVGDLWPGWASIDISYRVHGTATWTTQSIVVGGAQRTPLWWQQTITVPSRDVYDIKVVRTNGSRIGLYGESSLKWVGYDEILDEFVHYRGLQVMQLDLSAQDGLTSVPVVQVAVNKPKMTVLEWDGSTSTQIVDADDPAWVFYDMFTNKEYGLGLSATRLDEDAILEWSSWVSESAHGSKRAKFNMVFDTVQSFDESAHYVEQGGRAKIITKGSQVSVVTDKPEDPSCAYSDGNVSVDSMSMRVLPSAEKADGVEIEYIDSADNWSRATSKMAMSTAWDSLTRSPRVVRAFIPSINDSDQAYREALLRLNQSQATKRTITFGAGLDAIRSIPGDVFYFQDAGNKYQFGGRVADAVSGSTSMRIDQKIDLSFAVYGGGKGKIFIRREDDSIYERTITGAWATATDIITFATAISLHKYDVYMIVRTDSDKTMYRLTDLTRDDDLKFTISGAEYSSAAYYSTATHGTTAL